MFNDSHLVSCAVSSGDGTSPCCYNETLVQLLAGARANFDGDRDRAKACLWRAAELLQIGRSREAHRRTVSRVLGGLAPWQAIRVAAYIEANIESYFRAADLARIAQLSISHFSRAFRKTFGETPHTYTMKQRMLRAQLIMLTSQEPLARIAADCGMYDQAHFTRAFRKLVGVNPGVWRRQFSPETGAQAVRAHADASQNNPVAAMRSRQYTGTADRDCGSRCYSAFPSNSSP